MSTKKPEGVLTIADLRGGRNGLDAGDALQDNECQDAVNVEWYRTAVARRRAGSAATAFTASPFTGKVRELWRHVPSSDETGAECWGTDSAGNVGRLTAGTAWSTITPTDAVIAGTFLSAVSLSGKLFCAYNSTHDDRLHVWDGTTLRRAGLATPAAPTVANSVGGGAYAATLAYWRVRWVTISGSAFTLRSEPSPSTAFTPDGAHLGVVITRPTAAGEAETHWEIEVSTDNITFYTAWGSTSSTSAIAIATTTGSTSTAVATLIAASPVSALTGTYTVQKAYKFLAADQNRLLGFGDYIATTATTTKRNRIEVSAIIGSLNVGDAERVDTTNGYAIDLDENDSGDPTGLAGPVNGAFFAFKSKSTYVLTPQNSVSQPYSVRKLSSQIGLVQHSMVVVGEDEYGSPCLYWMSHRGPYRYGRNGIEYIGRGVEDLILGPTSTINLTATRPGQTVYHANRRQVWFWLATGSSNDADALVVYHLGSGDRIPSGWSRYTGDITHASCAVMFSSTVGATMSRDLVPYIGQYDSNNAIWKCDTGTQDNGTNYQAYVKTKMFAPWGLHKNGQIVKGFLVGQTVSATTITATLSEPWGNQTAKTSTASLAAAGSETQTRKKFEDIESAGLAAFDLQLGDSAAGNIAAWRLDRAELLWEAQEAS